MRVLITGTSSGLGKAFSDWYQRQGAEVIAVNRSTLDITDYPSVVFFLKSLMNEGRTPNLFILNAGINRPDNSDGLQYDAFENVMRTNLNGVMTFVAAIRSLGLRDRTVATISSTSNIVPNPGHIGYYVSKLALKKSFALLSKNDPHNRYKVVVLGPVHTQIMRGYPQPEGLQGKIFRLLAVSAEQTSVSCAKFFASDRRTLHYPLFACGFYWAVKALLFFLPGLYAGTKTLKTRPV